MRFDEDEGDDEMRNLAKYPITLDEIEACLLRLVVELDEPERIGDMTPLLLREAATIVRRTGFVTDNLRPRTPVTPADEGRLGGAPSGPAGGSRRPA
jgi:hypothetical protein